MGKRPSRWALALLAWMLAWPALAADLWDTLGPARVGVAHAGIAAVLPLSCSAAAEEQVCTVTSPSGQLFAGAPVRAIELRFDRQRLVRGSVSLSDRHYAALLSVLTAQFGASDDRTFVARGGMAAEFEAGVHLWEHAGVSVVLEQFAGKLDRSALTYGTVEAMADLVRSKTSYPRGARRDL